MARFVPNPGFESRASAGTRVRAVGDGVIRRANFSSSYGNVIELADSRGYGSR